MNRWIIIGASVLLSISSLGAMIADVVSHQVTRQEQRWLEGEKVTYERWSLAASQLRLASTLSPGTPDYLQTQGRLAYWSLFSDERSLLPAVENGLKPIRKALQIRPQWPYAWADLALIKSLAGQFDEEFSEALTNARAYGPWERPVLNRLLTTYFLSWGSLTNDQRLTGYELLSDALTLGKDQAQEALRLALNSPLQMEICSQSWELVESHGLTSLCTGMGVLRLKNEN